MWLLLGWLVGLVLAGRWPHTALHADAIDRGDSFVIATGLLRPTVEAVYFLDFLTGDLRAAVIAKQNGKFNAFFRRNVAG